MAPGPSRTKCARRGPDNPSPRHREACGPAVPYLYLREYLAGQVHARHHVRSIEILYRRSQRKCPARHEPMITLEQFERAQILLGKVGRSRPKQHVFAYTGLIRCGSCGCSVTAEQKVNRYGSHYVYYHCTRKKRGVVCSERCTEEHDLEEQIVPS